jgi:hypothetical protein
MTFFITPPVVVARGFSVSGIQIGHMELPESLVVSMATWSALDLLRHWRRELGALISGERSKACIVTGLLVVGERVVPTEWWPARYVDGKVLFHYQVLSTVEPGIPWNSPDTWWSQVKTGECQDSCRKNIHAAALASVPTEAIV